MCENVVKSRVMPLHKAKKSIQQGGKGGGNVAQLSDFV